MMPPKNVEKGGLRLETDFPNMCLYLDVSEGAGNNHLRDYLRLLDDSYMSIHNLNSFIIIVICFMGVSISVTHML